MSSEVPREMAEAIDEVYQHETDRIRARHDVRMSKALDLVEHLTTHVRSHLEETCEMGPMCVGGPTMEATDQVSRGTLEWILWAALYRLAQTPDPIRGRNHQQ